MFDIAQLLPLLQAQMQQKDGQNGSNPLANIDLNSLISGGGFGGGQTGGLLGKLFKGGQGKGIGGLLGGLFGGGASAAGTVGANAGASALGGIGGGIGANVATAGTSAGTSALAGFNPAGLYAAAGNVAGGLVAKNNTNKYGIIDDRSARGAGALKGAGTGAAIGSVVPVVGTAIGAGIGAIIGGATAGGNKDKVLKAYQAPAVDFLNSATKKDTQTSELTNSLYDFDGVETTGYAKYGGYVKKMATGGDVDPIDEKKKGKVTKSNPRNLNSAEKRALRNTLASQGSEGVFSADAVDYDPHGNGGIFATIDSLQSNYPTLDLGKYKDVGYFDVQTSPEGRYTVNNTKKNPANAALYKQQLDHISQLNPNANIARNSGSGFKPLIQLGLGGNAIPEYKVEDEEVIYAPEDNPPITDDKGTASKIGPNMFKFKGDKHSDSSGGIGVQGGNTPFVGSAGDVKQTGFVFSKKLKTDATKYLNGL